MKTGRVISEKRYNLLLEYEKNISLQKEPLQIKQPPVNITYLIDMDDSLLKIHLGGNIEGKDLDEIKNIIIRNIVLAAGESLRPSQIQKVTT